MQPKVIIASHDLPANPTVFAVFQDAVTSGVSDPQEIVKTALKSLQRQLGRPWDPRHSTIRRAILNLLSSPSEALELAEALLSQRGGADGR